VAPRFDALRGEPRFQAIVRAMRLDPEAGQRAESAPSS
jgi:hypothetical protein